MRSITEIQTFGSVDADSDTLLARCFEMHEAYKKAVARERYLILGRKGTGKTAIFRRLCDDPPARTTVLGFTHRDYPWDHHSLQVAVGTPSSQAYVQSWTYLMLLAWARTIINEDTTRPRSAQEYDSLRALRRFVTDSFGTTRPNLTEVFQKKHVLKIHPELGANIGGQKFSIKPESVPIENLPRFINQINVALANHVFRVASGESQHFLAFDELDQNYSPASEEYRDRLIGLVLAARNLNNDARRAGASIFAIVFLRDDIFDNLSFQDKNKVYQNDSAALEWDTTRTPITLRELMERRFTEALRSDNLKSLKWGDVFSGEEMTSRRDQYKYILDRTFNRPRDMIKFCNEAIVVHKQRVTGGVENTNRFTKEDLYGARERYSDYLRRELEDEMFSEVPEWARYLELIRSVGVVYFKFEDFLAVYNRRKQELGITAGHFEVLKALFKFSVLGYAVNSGGRVGTSYVFVHKSETKPLFDETAVEFRVHYGLIESLGLSTRSDSEAYKRLKDGTKESKAPAPPAAFARTLFDPDEYELDLT